ncbi:MAG: hypothetical protein AAFY99_07900 [Pseudomonadota bacterium]
MTDHTDDIKELEALLGHTKASYNSLQHEGSSSIERRSEQAPRRYSRFAIAASLLLALGASAFIVFGESGQGSLPQSRLANSMPASFAAPTAPSATVDAGAFTRARQFPISFSMPTRPVATSG